MICKMIAILLLVVWICHWSYLWSHQPFCEYNARTRPLAIVYRDTVLSFGDGQKLGLTNMLLTNGLTNYYLQVKFS